MIVAALGLLTGCLSPAPPPPTNWTIEFDRVREQTVQAAAASRRLGDTVRLASVDVLAPYAGPRLAVLRSDGSVAFDPFNAFAAAPAMLLKGVAHDLLESSGLFARVIPTGSFAQSQYVMEIRVRQLALDCRAENVRKARVALAVMLLKNRDPVAGVSGEGTVVAESDFSAAFSEAFARALGEALGKLPLK